MYVCVHMSVYVCAILIYVLEIGGMGGALQKSLVSVTTPCCLPSVKKCVQLMLEKNPEHSNFNVK